MRRQFWFVAVIVVVVFLAPCAARGQEYVFAPDDGIVERLLAPDVSPFQKLGWFHELQLRPGRGWSHAHLVVKQARSANPVRREVGRWVLMAMVGPEWYGRLMGEGPEAKAALARLEGLGRTAEFERLREYAQIRAKIKDSAPPVSADVSDAAIEVRLNTGPDWSADTIVRLLLNPAIGQRSKLRLFWELEKRPAQGLSTVPVVLDRLRLGSRVQRKEADWVLWCMVGPGWHARLTASGDEGRAALADFEEMVEVARRGLFTARGPIFRSLRSRQDWLQKKGVDVTIRLVSLHLRIGYPIDAELIELLRIAWVVDPSSRDQIVALALRAPTPAITPAIVFGRSRTTMRPDEAIIRAGIPGYANSYNELLWDFQREGRDPLRAFKPDLVDGFLTQTGDIGRATKIANAIRAVGRGERSAMDQVVELGQKDHPATHFAQAIAQVDVAYRGSMLEILEDPRRAAEVLPFMFAGNDVEARRAAMKILSVSGEYIDGPAVLRGIARAAGKLEPEVARMVPVESKELVPALLKLLQSQEAGIRLGALALIAGASKKDDAVLAAIKPLLKDSDERVRQLAAEGIGTERARSMARLPAVLEDLRASDKGTRMAAARRFESLEVFDRAVGAALMRATDGGNMAAREGLLGAIERAYAADREDVWTVLAEMSEGPVSLARTYARAALREVGQK